MIASVEIRYVRTPEGPATLDLVSSPGGIGASAHIGMGPTYIARHKDGQDVALLQFDNDGSAENWIAIHSQWKAERIT